MKNALSAVVFDMDGVIFDTERLCLDGWKLIAEKEGYENIEETCIRCIGTTTPETNRILRSTYGDELEIDRLHGELKKYIAEFVKKNGLPIKKGAAEILRGLKEMGLPLAIASSTKTETVKAQLDSAGFLRYFNAVIGGDMAGRSKPFPDIYLEACKVLEVLPEKAAAIEDSYNGIRAAHSAGMLTIMVPDIVPPDEEIKNLSDYICKDLSEAFITLQNLKTMNI